MELLGKNKSDHICDHITKEALLEQMAEECSEANFAALKLSRLRRGENPVYGRDEKELVRNLEEEIADIMICIDELERAKLVSYSNIGDIISQKEIRMRRRIRMGEK